MNRLSLVFCLAVVAPACMSPTARDGKRDCEHCPEMVAIPAGTAILGASADDQLHNADELPERRFVIREPFAVSRYEITRASAATGS